MVGFLHPDRRANRGLAFGVLADRMDCVAGAQWGVNAALEGWHFMHPNQWFLSEVIEEQRRINYFAIVGMMQGERMGGRGKEHHWSVTR